MCGLFSRVKSKPLQGKHVNFCITEWEDRLCRSSCTFHVFSRENNKDKKLKVFKSRTFTVPEGHLPEGNKFFSSWHFSCWSSVTFLVTFTKSGPWCNTSYGYAWVVAKSAARCAAGPQKGFSSRCFWVTAADGFSPNIGQIVWTGHYSTPNDKTKKNSRRKIHGTYVSVCKHQK